MNRIRLFVVCLVVACGAGLGAIQKPGFSGTWIIQPPNKAAGQEIVIKQDDRTLTIASGGRTMAHQLDDVEHKETRAMRGGEIVMLTKAGWKGGTILVTTSTAYPNKMKTLAKEVWSIDAQGQLVIDFTETAEGEAPRVIQVVHKRKS